MVCQEVTNATEQDGILFFFKLCPLDQSRVAPTGRINLSAGSGLVGALRLSDDPVQLCQDQDHPHQSTPSSHRNTTLNNTRGFKSALTDQITSSTRSLTRPPSIILGICLQLRTQSAKLYYWMHASDDWQSYCLPKVM